MSPAGDGEINGAWHEAAQAVYADLVMHVKSRMVYPIRPRAFTWGVLVAVVVRPSNSSHG